MSLRGTDVAAMMTRVAATLAAAERSPEGASGVLGVAPEGDTEINVAALRGNADIRIDFPPGSGRRIVGPAVRLAKRALRRSVSWYVTPMMEQQSSLNHALLDSIERLRLRVEGLGASPGGQVGAGLPPVGKGSRAVVVGPSATTLAALVAPGGTDAQAAGLEVVAGDAVTELRRRDTRSLDLVVADVAGMAPERLVDLVQAAFDALAPRASVVLAPSGPDGAQATGRSLHPRALAWVLGAVGFDQPHTVTLESVAVSERVAGADLVDGLVRVDEAVRAGVAVVVASRAP